MGHTQHSPMYPVADQWQLSSDFVLWPGMLEAFTACFVWGLQIPAERQELLSATSKNFEDHLGPSTQISTRSGCQGNVFNMRSSCLEVFVASNRGDKKETAAMILNGCHPAVEVLIPENKSLGDR